MLGDIMIMLILYFQFRGDLEMRNVVVVVAAEDCGVVVVLMLWLSKKVCFSKRFFPMTPPATTPAMPIIAGNPNGQFDLRAVKVQA